MAGYDPSLDFERPVCEAPPKEMCVTMSGNFCSAFHIERKWIVRDHHPKWSITKACPAEELKAHTSGGGAIRKSGSLGSSPF
jgi:hypothetical protein